MQPSTPILQRQTAGTKQEDKDLALFGGPIAQYNVDKQGKILNWDMDHIAKKVFQALSESKQAYIRINGHYPRGDTDFDPNEPPEIAKRALVQWIGKSKIPDIEKRIVTYYGGGGPFPANIGGEVAVEVAYSSLGPGAIPPGPAPSTSLVGPNGGESAPKPTATTPSESKPLIPIPVFDQLDPTVSVPDVDGVPDFLRGKEIKLSDVQKAMEIFQGKNPFSSGAGPDFCGRFGMEEAQLGEFKGLCCAKNVPRSAETCCRASRIDAFRGRCCTALEISIQGRCTKLQVVTTPKKVP